MKNAVAVIVVVIVAVSIDAVGDYWDPAVELHSIATQFSFPVYVTNDVINRKNDTNIHAIYSPWRSWIY